MLEGLIVNKYKDGIKQIEESVDGRSRRRERVRTWTLLNVTPVGKCLPICGTPCMLCRKKCCSTRVQHTCTHRVETEFLCLEDAQQAVGLPSTQSDSRAIRAAWSTWDSLQHAQQTLLGLLKYAQRVSSGGGLAVLIIQEEEVTKNNDDYTTTKQPVCCYGGP